MSNTILTKGVVTPFVQFNFVGGSIESNINNPRYFMSFEHNRTCKEACTFKLGIVYVPDTFSPGDPTVIDDLIIHSIRDKVTYCYGYYDCFGERHVQQQSYCGQVYTYSSDIDVSSATINYTVEGTATAADLSNSIGKIEEVSQDKKPSVHLRYLTAVPTDGGFRDLKNMYNIYTDDNTDEEVHIPNLGSGPVLDLIMGTTINSGTKNNGLPVRQGGLVQLAHAKKSESVEDAYKKGLVSESDYHAYKNAMDAKINSQWDANYYGDIKNKVKDKLVTPFCCFIDDIVTSSKYGTLYFVRNTGWETDNVYEYEFGNNVRNSDVLAFSVSYDGASAIAAASASQNSAASIDADGNGIGQTVATTQVNGLGRNTFPTKSGFDENAFLSKTELSNIMLYPYEASMTIMGQIHTNQLLDIIYIVVRVNGTEHPVLTGAYKILEIVDNVDSSGFTTTFNLIREVNESVAVTNNMESYNSTPNAGESQNVDDARNKTIEDDENSSTVQNQ